MRYTRIAALLSTLAMAPTFGIIPPQHIALAIVVAPLSDGQALHGNRDGQ